MRFGVIGTNWITAALIEAGRTVPGVEFTAVLSRSDQTGARFAEQHGLTRVHTDVADLAADPEVDAVYVASPNSLHAEQTEVILRAGRHVLTEKPLATNAAEVAHLDRVARSSGVLLMEAYVAPFEPNVIALREAVPRVGTLRRVVLVKDQYSSRYDALKAGGLPNAFNPEFAGGSLMDLGIYPVALSVLLFGPPQAVTASGILLASGVDGQGTIRLGYDGFEVLALHSKIAPCGIESQIAGESGVLTFDDCSVPTRVRLTPRGGAAEDLAPGQSPAHMRYEVEHLVDTVRAGATTSSVWPVSRSLEVMEILDEARRQVGVVFPSDH